MTRMSYSGLLVPGRLEGGVGDGLAAMIRGFDALDFLERSRELAAETVVTSGPGACRTQDELPSRREDLPGSGAWPPVR
jgi:hypothetical protein